MVAKSESPVENGGKHLSTILLVMQDFATIQSRKGVFEYWQDGVRSIPMLWAPA